MKKEDIQNKVSKLSDKIRSDLKSFSARIAAFFRRGKTVSAGTNKAKTAEPEKLSQKRKSQKPARFGRKKLFKNRKSLIACLAAVLFVLALITAFLVIVFAVDRDKSVPLAVLDTCYDISVVFSQDMKQADITEEVLYTNQSGEELDCLVFHLFPNVYNESGGKIEVLSADFNGKTVVFDIYGKNDALLKISGSISDGNTVSVSIVCRLTLPQTDDRLGITSAGTVNMSCFYPVMSVFENGSWREDDYTEIGDPFYTVSSGFYVTVSAPETYAIASSGTVTEKSAADGIKISEIVAENARDFAMVLSRGFSSLASEVEIDGRKVNVDYFYVSDTDPSDTLSSAAKALTAFSKAFGAYPFDDYTVAESPLTSSGMEYGGMAIVVPGISRADRRDTVVHETAHQWWYNVVGSDQINSAWLDEGLTEFCTAYFYLLQGNGDGYGVFMRGVSASHALFAVSQRNTAVNYSMNRALSSFTTNSEYVAVTYLRGAMLFDTLYSLCGQKKFERALQIYYRENAYGIAKQKDLVSAFESAGCNAGAVIDNWSGGNIKI